MTDIDFLKNYKVGILAGGPSSEREVSLKSGRAVLAALQGKGVETVFIDVKQEDILPEIMSNGVNLIFIALHGKFGEDGTVQEILTVAGIPYTGSGPEASRIAIDKLASKQKFIDAGLMVPGYRSILSKDDIILAIEEIQVPCVVKPRYEGSSIGLSVVTEQADLVGAIEKAIDFGGEAMVETFIYGKELTVGVLEDRALPVVEITAASGVYDYASKYISQGTRYHVPCDIGHENYRRAQLAGLKAHKALGCRSFSRTDMRLDPSGELYILEVNTIPGLTEKSLLPMAAKADGVDFGELCVKMLMGAFKR